jgi:hypothetical protein
VTGVAKRLYVDTSAYLCVLLGEPGHKAVEKELLGGSLVASTLLVIEATRNLVRLSRRGVLTAVQLRDGVSRVETDCESFALRDFTLDLCSGPFPVVSTPRSVDLAHLRTALWFHQQEPLDRFVTLDREQELAAGELGLPV